VGHASGQETTATGVREAARSGPPARPGIDADGARHVPHVRLRPSSLRVSAPAQRGCGEKPPSPDDCQRGNRRGGDRRRARETRRVFHPKPGSNGYRWMADPSALPPPRGRRAAALPHCWPHTLRADTAPIRRIMSPAHAHAHGHDGRIAPPPAMAGAFLCGVDVPSQGTWQKSGRAGPLARCPGATRSAARKTMPAQIQDGSTVTE